MKPDAVLIRPSCGHADAVWIRGPWHDRDPWFCRFHALTISANRVVGGGEEVCGLTLIVSRRGRRRDF